MRFQSYSDYSGEALSTQESVFEKIHRLRWPKTPCSVNGRQNRSKKTKCDFKVIRISVNGCHLEERFQKDQFLMAENAV